MQPENTWLIILQTMVHRALDVSDNSMKILYAFGAIVLFSKSLIMYWFLVETIPRAWLQTDYSTTTISEMKENMPGYAGDHAFKEAWGWIHKGFLTESWLRLSPQIVTTDGEIIESFEQAELQKWIKIPIIGRKRLSYSIIWMSTEELQRVHDTFGSSVPEVVQDYIDRQS